MVDVNENFTDDPNFEFYEIKENKVDLIEKKDKLIQKKIQTKNKLKKIVPQKNKKINQNIIPSKKIVNINPKKIDKTKFKFSNEKNSDWKIVLRNRLLDSLDNRPELTIKKEKSLIKVIRDKAIYVEQARIIIDHEDGRQDSFRALINSETGKIIKSWDRTIHEHFIEKPMKFSPSGKL